jgi:hypothetical protein
MLHKKFMDAITLEMNAASEDQKRAFLAGLNAVCNSSTPTLNELRDWLASTLETEVVEPAARRDREVLERRKVGKGTYQLEKIRCGKPKCKCNQGALHGGYWYFYWREGGKLRSRYIGKKKPAELNDAIAQTTTGIELLD